MKLLVMLVPTLLLATLGYAHVPNPDKKQPIHKEMEKPRKSNGQLYFFPADKHPMPPQGFKYEITLLYSAEKPKDEAVFSLRAIFTNSPPGGIENFAYIGAMIEWSGTAENPRAKIYGTPKAELLFEEETSAVELKLHRDGHTVYSIAVIHYDEGVRQVILEQIDLDQLQQYPNSHKAGQLIEFYTEGSIELYPGERISSDE